MKDSFVLYTKYSEQLELLTMEQRGELITAIFECMKGNEPSINGVVAMAFSFIKTQLDADAEKYEEVCRKRAEAGKMGGRPKKQMVSDENQEKAKKANGFSEKQTKTKKADNEYEYDNDIKEKVISKDITKKKTIRFSPPTVSEVQAYCQEKGYNIDADKFVSFYESKGWMVGKNKMKDWKSAVRGWASRERSEGKKQPTKFSNFQERQYDDSVYLNLIEM